jgi:hypothetical protein
MYAFASANPSSRRRLWLAAIALVAVATLPVLGQIKHDDANKKVDTPPGLFITPKALPHSVQQVLNPGLANYPNFVAGEAVKEAVSPDG